MWGIIDLVVSPQRRRERGGSQRLFMVWRNETITSSA
jgi:hypothetical protein